LTARYRSHSRRRRYNVYRCYNLLRPIHSLQDFIRSRRRNARIDVDYLRIRLPFPDLAFQRASILCAHVVAENNHKQAGSTLDRLVSDGQSFVEAIAWEG
jgi:hypothetical protein